MDDLLRKGKLQVLDCEGNKMILEGFNGKYCYRKMRSTADGAERYDDKPDKNDFNYEIGTNIDVFLTKNAKLSSTLAYISAKQSAYNLKGEDLLANLRFTKTVLKGLEVYAATADDGEYIMLEKQESIKGFTPYILYAENGFDQTMKGTIDASNYPESTSVTDGFITGVLCDTEVSAGYVLQNKGDGAKFYKIGSTPFTIPAGKCYANPRSYNAPALSFQFGEEETDGIQSATALPTQSQKMVYDLQGKRVLNPQSGHIYVINGQKVLKR